MSVHWMELTAAEVGARAAADALVIIPVASLEQHGPHLAAGTDIILASAIADRVARRLESAIVTPCVWTGLAEHHMAFGGTVTLDHAAFAAVLGGVLRSVARAGFRRALLLNGHGGNAEAVALVASELSAALGIRIAAGTYWHVAPEAIAPLLTRQPHLMHACEAETAMVMALRPDCIRPEHLPAAHGPASTRVEGQPPGLALRRGFREITPSGVIGDARGATPEQGGALLEAIVTRLAAVLRAPGLWA